MRSRCSLVIGPLGARMAAFHSRENGGRFRPRVARPNSRLATCFAPRIVAIRTWRSESVPRSRLRANIPRRIASRWALDNGLPSDAALSLRRRDSGITRPFCVALILARRSDEQGHRRRRADTRIFSRVSSETAFPPDPPLARLVSRHPSERMYAIHQRSAASHSDSGTSSSTIAVGRSPRRVSALSQLALCDLRRSLM